MAEPTYQISIIDDEGQVTGVPLMRDEFTVGRKEGNVIRLTERNVSRNHARILRETGRFFLNDLGSYNGTRLNGRRIRGKMPLSPGDEIGIGDYTLRIDVAAESATTVPPPAAEQVRPPQLTVVADGRPGAVHVLTDVPHVIGRGEEATIRLDDPAAARTQARLHLLQGRYFVEDLGGGSGILIGGRRVRSKALEPGDAIEIGRVQLYFTLGALRPEDIKPRAAPPAPARASRLPMLLGIVGAVVVVAGVIYVLLLHNKSAAHGSAPAGPDTTTVAAVEDAGPAAPETGGAVAVAPVEAGPEAAAVAPPPAADVAVADAAASVAQRLAAARDAADHAAGASDWDAVLALLGAPELAADDEAAKLRETATRERDASRALDDARKALAAGDAAAAVGRLAVIPAGVRCAAEAGATWNEVFAAGREAGRGQKVDDLRALVEALRAVGAPDPPVARGRDELVALLRRLDQPATPAVDAGTAVRPHDAGVAAPPDARVRVEAVAAVHDAGAVAVEAAGAGNAADEAYRQAKQLVLNGDNQGCIDVLTRAPETCRNLEVLVACYKAASRMTDAYGAMQNYVRRCNGQRKYDEYVEILQSAGRMP